MAELHSVKTVFLDRDGVVTVERGLYADPGLLELLPGSAEAVRSLNHAGIRVIMITNQPGPAKGVCTMDDVNAMHTRLASMLATHGAHLDRIYSCAHHPEKNERGDPALQIECSCRKPKPGMLLTAKNDFGLDFAHCVMIGDASSDILAAKAAGVRSILVKTGRGILEGTPDPDFIFPTLLDAVTAILQGYKEPEHSKQS